MFDDIEDSLPPRKLKCPDCKEDALEENVGCHKCGLSWHSIMDAAEYYEAMKENFDDRRRDTTTAETST